ncbi:hypothetical protein Y032_0016g3066 [Ancylostoma ceylanicum]|nr:hypothetical protein Y032_0016g3066 [Ancylostoma ceylanicum]
MRAAIIRMHQDERSTAQIVKMLSVPRTTVQDTVRRFREHGSIEDRKNSGRLTTATDPEIVKNVRSRLD